MQTGKMKGKLLLFGIITLFSIGLLAFLPIDTEGVWLSFLISVLIQQGLFYYHLFIEKTWSPFLSAFLVFTFLFFSVAPIVQIASFENANPKFETLFPYDKGLTVYTNILICMFNVIFTGAYLFFKRNLKSTKIVPVIIQDRYTPLFIMLLAGIAILTFLASLGFVVDEIRRPAWMPSDFSKTSTLVWKKFFFFLPFTGIILCVEYFKRKSTNPKNMLFVLGAILLFGVLIFWFKNPFNEKRHALGPVYFTLIYLFVPKIFNTNFKTLLFLFLIMVIAFPASALFTHTDATFAEILRTPTVLLEDSKGGTITSAFNTLNYDAFSNILATIDYTTIYGLSWGYQLLCTLLFFVPRSIWTSKSVATGELIGNHLMERYDFKYNNLSNPIVSEFYINFGVIGVCIAAVLLAWFLVFFIKWLQSKSPLKRIMAFYFAIHLIFLLRGDLINGFSYYIGPIFAVILAPKAFYYFASLKIKK